MSLHLNPVTKCGLKLLRCEHLARELACAVNVRYLLDQERGAGIGHGHSALKYVEVNLSVFYFLLFYFSSRFKIYL